MSSITAYAGSVPANYEKYLGPLLFEPYALHLVERLKNERLTNVLELACGTGRVTQHLARLIGENGQLMATDLNPDMLALAQKMFNDKRIKWQVADAQQLPFGDESFEHIICQFGVMLFPDKKKAFAEAFRLLQKGGKYIFSVWDEVTQNPEPLIIKKVMDEMFGEDSPDFLKKGPYSFSEKEEIQSLLAHAGFKNILIETIQKFSPYSDVEEIIIGFVDGSPLTVFMQSKPRDVQDEIRRRLKLELTAHGRQYGFQMKLQALVVESVK